CSGAYGRGSPGAVLCARGYPGGGPSSHGPFVVQSMHVAVAHAPGPNAPQKLTQADRWLAHEGVGPVQSKVGAAVHAVCPSPQVQAMRTPAGPQAGNVTVVVDVLVEVVL